MRKKTDDRERGAQRPEADAGTSSFEQTQGAQDSKSAPNRPNEKMPHERDESARPSDDRSNESAPASQRQISQAEKDVSQGQVDTDRRGVPNDVPGGRR